MLLSQAGILIEGHIRQGPLNPALCTEYSRRLYYLRTLYQSTCTEHNEVGAAIAVVALASTWRLLAITNHGAKAWLLLAVSCTYLTMHPFSRLKVKPIKTAVSLYPT